MPRTKKQLQVIRDKTTQDILDAALELFAIKGFRGTTTQDIAKKAKISKGLIYNYFKTKDEIIEVLFKQKLTLATNMITEISKISDPLNRMEKLMTLQIEEVKREEKLYRLFYASALLPKNIECVDKLSKKFSKTLEGIHHSLDAVLSAHKDDKGKDNIILFRACLLGIIMGYLINPKYFNPNILKETLIGKIKEQIEHGMCENAKLT